MSIELRSLRQVLAEQFSADELATLAFDLGLNVEELPGEGLGGRAREMVRWFEQRGRLGELAAEVRRQRPQVQFRFSRRRIVRRVRGERSGEMAEVTQIAVLDRLISMVDTMRQDVSAIRTDVELLKARMGDVDGRLRRMEEQGRPAPVTSWQVWGVLMGGLVMLLLAAAVMYLLVSGGRP